jgi:hypothetical protein
LLPLGLYGQKIPHSIHSLLAPSHICHRITEFRDTEARKGVTCIG